MAIKRQAGIAVVEADRLFEETIECIQALAKWGINWKDYNAPPPSRERIERAEAWMKAMHCDAQALDLPWLKPMITASAEGEILFEWWNEPKRLAVYVTESGVDYIKAWGPHIFDQMEEGSADTSESRCALWRWLAS